MSKSSSNYPIAETLKKIIRSSRLSRGYFLESVGYRNLNSAVRQLDRWLTAGEGDPLLLERVVYHYPLFSGQAEHSLLQTRELRQAECRLMQDQQARPPEQNHRPCLVVETEATVPGQIALYAIAGRRFKVIPLPGRIAWIEDRRSQKIVRRQIRRYLKRFGGACPFWGEVTGFTFSISYRRQLRFDRSGDIVSVDTELPGVLRAAAYITV